MTFTRNRSDTNGVGTPDAAEVGMTPVDPLFREAAGDHGARADGVVPAVRLGSRTTIISRRAPCPGATTCRGCAGKHGCAAAGFSSISTTAARTPAARAAR